MELTLPDKVSYILDTLHSAGFEGYAVGGCIRDSLLGKEPKDWDITTSATPKEVKSLFPHTVDTGISHGTVTVLLEREGFEVTTYRIDGKYEDSRHPKEVTFTPNLLEDLKRRDFTINAMAYNQKDGLVDAFDGVGDLRRGLIRCVGDAKQRFKEDALRLMRAVRFAAQLGFSIERETYAAICEMAGDLRRISVERIAAELVGLLVSDYPEKIRALYESGITSVILPEFDAMMQTEQKNPHHLYTVGEHTIAALSFVEKDKILRLAVLLHDVAKPLCETVDEEGVSHFHGHPELGGEMAKRILRRLKFDNCSIQSICRLVSAHDDNPPLTERSVRRVIMRIGTDAFPALFALKRADILAQSNYQRQEKLEYLDGFQMYYRKIIEAKDCLTLKELAVSGSDLIQAGMAEGPALGETLKELLELVIDDPKKNTKEYLLEQVK
ncbi:MAG: HD domain-containing protein [Eubacterium sp.]|jgi:tRNA nucleotidyltransferase (CCA-adding enzyme)|nr:HD domain-containing protein [Eubacterium sp.]